MLYSIISQINFGPARRNTLLTARFGVVAFEKYNILSMRIYGEGCGAYCSSANTYFSFDLKTGETLKIADLIAENKIDRFREI